MDIVASPRMHQYFAELLTKVDAAYVAAQAARAKGFDPVDEVEIPLAKNMAERVLGLVSTVAPQLRETRLTQRIEELEREFGKLDWRVGFKIAEEVAKQQLCPFASKEEAMTVGIRVGFAYLTLGIVAAPLEGFIGIKIKKRQDGKEYLSAFYAGPVRGAGGTAAAVSVILIDCVRMAMGYEPYDPTETEVKRYITEIHDYHERATNLQYHPSDDEIKFLVEHVPIEINGDPTEQFEVSNHKGLPRVETNRVRGGICLVIAEGIAQKAPKLWKRLSSWGKSFNLQWDFLQEFLELQKKIKAKQAEATKEKKEGEQGKDEGPIRPNYTFIADIVAGRPVLTYPMRAGGFRLRYGRTRVSGFSATAVHPATLALLNRYIAIGTQLKVERPGKASVVTVCESIDGPIVKLSNGSVLALAHAHEAKNLAPDVVEIIYLGDILYNYGDFSENGHRLVPAGYCNEWWVAELSRSAEKKNEQVPPHLTDFRAIPSLQESIALSKKYYVPLHPAYTYHWKHISVTQLRELVEWLMHGHFEEDNEGLKKIVLPLRKEWQDAKRSLELIGVPHNVVQSEYAVLDKTEAQAIMATLSLEKKEDLPSLSFNGMDTNALAYLQAYSAIPIRDRSGTFIGARMGRPEKAKMRKLDGSPQVLFPVGDEGDRTRALQAALAAKKVTAEFPCYYCKSCAHKTIYRICEQCSQRTEKRYFCGQCGELASPCRHEATPYREIALDIGKYFADACSRIGTVVVPDLIKGVRGTINREHHVEHLAKGIARAQHSIYVNKDGTTRYDCTEMPITHFKPKEIKTTVERLRQLGYTHDIQNNELTHDDQAIELKPQDIILPGYDSLDESAGKVLLRVAQFVDKLLERLYGLPRFYNLKAEEDLVGHLVIGLAPHISSAMVGRVIGFSETQGLLAHPMWHAALRRDCLEYNSRIHIFDGKNWKETKIGQFVEQFGPTTKSGTYGTLVKKIKNFSTLSINKKTGRLEINKISEVSKHPSTGSLIEIITPQTKITVTEDHKFLTIKNKKIVLKEANSLSKNNKLLLLNHISFHKKKIKKYRINEIKIKKIHRIKNNKSTYCLNVERNHNFVANNLFVKNCDGDEASVLLLMDALLNFSRKFLPETRGSAMDAPLVLTAILDPSEVDDQALGIDVAWQYPLELYEAAAQYKFPWEVKVEQLRNRLGTEKQYEGAGFTHPVDNLNAGVTCSAYKTIPLMEEKLKGQMELANKIRAVDKEDVASLVIQKHLLKDIRGNLRQFFQQQFRCGKCNKKYRKPPLVGKCIKCGNNLLFTVSEGNITKYLQISIDLVNAYDVSPYLKQNIAITKKYIEVLFGKEKEKQAGLGMWVGASKAAPHA